MNIKDFTLIHTIGTTQLADSLEIVKCNTVDAVNARLNSLISRAYQEMYTTFTRAEEQIRVISFLNKLTAMSKEKEGIVDREMVEDLPHLVSAALLPFNTVFMLNITTTRFLPRIDRTGRKHVPKIELNASVTMRLEDDGNVSDDFLVLYQYTQKTPTSFINTWNGGLKYDGEVTEVVTFN